MTSFFQLQEQHDILTVHDGGSLDDSVIGYKNSKRTSTSNQLTLHFTSDASISMDGFLATFSTRSEHINTSPDFKWHLFLQRLDSNYESTELICDYQYSEDTGELMSPKYPENYSNEAYCTTTIQVSEGARILLVFYTFEVTILLK